MAVSDIDFRTAGVDGVAVAANDVPGAALATTAGLYAAGYLGDGAQRHPVVAKFLEGNVDVTYGHDGIVDIPVPGVGEASLAASSQTRGVVVAGTTLVGGVPTAFVAEVDGDGRMVNSFGTGGVLVVDLGPGADTVRSIDGMGVGLSGTLVGTAGGRPAAARVSDVGLDTTFGIGGVAQFDLPTGATLAAVYGLVFGGRTVDGHPYLLAPREPLFGTNGLVILPGNGEVQAISSTYGAGFAPYYVSVVASSGTQTTVTLVSLTWRGELDTEFAPNGARTVAVGPNATVRAAERQPADDRGRRVAHGEVATDVWPTPPPAPQPAPPRSKRSRRRGRSRRRRAPTRWFSVRTGPC